MAFWLSKHLPICGARFCSSLFFFIPPICSYYLDLGILYLGSCNVFPLAFHLRHPCLPAGRPSTLIYHQSSAINNTLSEGSSTLIKLEWRNLSHCEKPCTLPTKYPSPPAIYPVATNSSRNVIPSRPKADPKFPWSVSTGARDLWHW